MPRGGQRKGSGSKSGWKHGKTKVIRVPEVLADQIIEYARDLDEGKTSTKNVKQVTPMLKIIDLSGISITSISGQMGVRLSDLVDKGYRILPDHLNQIVVNALKHRGNN